MFNEILKKSKMKHLLLCLFITITFFSLGQNQVNDSLKIIKNRGNFLYFQGGKQVYKEDFEEKLSQNIEAYYYYRKGSNHNLFGTLLTIGGGAGIGWTIGTFLSEGEPNWTPGIIGFGAFIVSLPFNLSGESNIKYAVSKYNKELPKPLGFWDKNDLLFNVSANRFSLTLNF